MCRANTITQPTTGGSILRASAKEPKGAGWYSFDQQGVHFVGMVNSAALEGMGKLGPEQLAWLKDDLSGKIFQHSDRGVRPPSSLDRLSGLGMGHCATVRKRWAT